MKKGIEGEGVRERIRQGLISLWRKDTKLAETRIGLGARERFVESRQSTRTGPLHSRRKNFMGFESDLGV